MAKKKIKSGISTAIKAQHLDKVSELDRLFEIQRVENNAAVLIQKSWRRTRVLLPWRKAVLSSLMAVKIQRVARGMVVRKLVARWYKAMIRVTILIQSLARRYLSNKHIKKQLINELRMVIRIQKIVRGIIARNKVNKSIRQKAATKIQKIWRGIVGRTKADKNWLNKVVIPIQNAGRRLLAMRRISLIRSDANQSALIIQKVFRNWNARRRLGISLYQREMKYRKDSIKKLSSEEELCIEKLTKLINRLTANGFKEDAERAMTQLTRNEWLIYSKENDLIETKRQLDILSPRAIQQGWKDALKKAVVMLRDEVTELKCKLLFEDVVKVADAEERYESAVHEIEELSSLKQVFSIWKNDEYEERRHTNYKKEITQKRLDKKLAIAEERRKWKVLFYTKDGKPDKKRQSGRPWDPSVYAGDEKKTYSGGVQVDLLAFQHSSPSGNVKDQVDQRLNEITLQTYLEQVNHYEQLLNPVLNILQQNYGANPIGKPTPAQSGWGPIGDRLGPALRTIGAIPKVKQLKTPTLSRIRESTAHHKDYMYLGELEGIDEMDEDDAASGMSSLSAGETRTMMMSKDPLKKDFQSFGLNNKIFQSTLNADSFSRPPTSQLVDNGSLLNNGDSIQSGLKSKSYSIRSFQKRVGMFSDEERLEYGSPINKQKSTSSGPHRGSLYSLNSKSSALSPITNESNFIRVGHNANMEISFGSSTRSEMRAKRERSGRYSSVVLPALESPNGVKPLRGQEKADSSIKRSKSNVMESMKMTSDEPSLVGGLRRMSHSSTNFSNEYTDNQSKLSKISNEVQWDLFETQKRRVREKKQTIRCTGIIPWELLDKLEGEKHRLESEKAYVEFNLKF